VPVDENDDCDANEHVHLIPTQFVTHDPRHPVSNSLPWPVSYSRHVLGLSGWPPSISVVVVPGLPVDPLTYYDVVGPSWVAVPVAAVVVVGTVAAEHYLVTAKSYDSHLLEFAAAVESVVAADRVAVVLVVVVVAVVVVPTS